MRHEVAVERPHAGVVGVELQHGVVGGVVGAGPHEVGVAAHGVVGVGNAAVPRAGTLGQHPEVVRVQVHRVRDGRVVVDHQPDGGVLAKVVHVPLRVLWEGRVAEVGEEEERVAVG